jgi:hypothetical protein
MVTEQPLTGRTCLYSRIVCVPHEWNGNRAISGNSRLALSINASGSSWTDVQDFFGHLDRAN